MDIEALRFALLDLPACSEDTPFGEDVLTFRVLGKIFACIDLNRPDRVVLHFSVALVDELRTRFVAVNPAYHWHKKYWVEIVLNQDVSDVYLLKLLRLSYAFVLYKLPKKQQLAFFVSRLPREVIFRHLNVCGSTMENAWSLGDAACASSSYEMALVHADKQRHGRGQLGTIWDSASGENLTFSFAVAPSFLPINRSFCLLQTAAVALHQSLISFIPEDAEKLTIKWPNDIYYEDEKLCGTLIQNNFSEGIFRLSVIGIGLNVNQHHFPTYVPNPTSLSRVLHCELGRFVILEEFITHFLSLFASLRNACQSQPSSISPDETAEKPIRDYYLRHLYRREGLYRWREGDNEFEASIHDVLPTGSLQLRLDSGELRTYAFKEVQYIL